MAIWKVLFIAVLACACLASATAVFVVPFEFEGTARWTWMGGLVAATVAAGGLFALFLRYAGHELLPKPRYAPRGRVGQ